MAIQIGGIQFTGKLGDLVGRKVGDKVVIQKPGGFTVDGHKKKRRKDKRVRENYAEFRNSIKFATTIYNIPDALHSRTHRGGRAYTHFIKKLVALQRQFDATNQRGKRQPQPHMLDFLVNMGLNNYAQKTWMAEPVFQQTGPLEVTAFVQSAERALEWPVGANVCAIFFYTAELNFTSLSRTRLHYSHHPITDILAEHEITIPLFEGPCIILVGVEFYQVVNNQNFLFENRSHNPLYIAFAKQ